MSRLQLFTNWLHIRVQWFNAIWVPIGDVRIGDVVILPQHYGAGRMLERHRIASKTIIEDWAVLYRHGHRTEDRIELLVDLPQLTKVKVTRSSLRARSLDNV